MSEPKKSSSIKKVIYNSGIYSITSILQKAVGFLLLPVYTIYLTPDDYGIIGIVNSITTVLTLLFTLSLNGAVQRFYYIYKSDKEVLKSFYGTIFSFVILNSIVLSVLIITFQKWVITPFVEYISFYPYILIGILTIIFNPIYTIYQSLLQTMQKGKEFGINSLLNFVVMVSLNILLIIVFELGAVGQLLSYLITAVIFGIHCIYTLYSKKIINLKFNLGYLKEALSYSVPLLPHLMSTSIATLFSRILLNNQISIGSAGLFNIASQLMIIVDTFQMSINSAYVPWFFNEMDNKPIRNQQIIDFADLLSRGYLIISIGLSFFIKEIIQVFLPADYLQVWTLIPVMVVAYQFKSIYLFYVNTLFYNTKATKFIFIGSVSGSFINIIISVFLTKLLGLMTPAVAILVQWIVTSAIVIILSKKIEPVDFKLNKMIFYVIFLILSIFIGQYYDLIDPLRSISIPYLLYKVVLFIILSLVLIQKDLPILIAEIKQFKK